MSAIFKAIGSGVRFPGGGGNVTRPAVAEGDWMLLVVAVDIATHEPTVPAGWALLQAVDNDSAFNASVHVYAKTAGASEPTDYAVGTGGTAGGGVIAVWEGVGAIDVSGVFTDSNLPSITCPTVTTTQDDTTLICVAGTLATAVRTFAPPAGMTERFDGNFGASIGIFDEVIPAAGATGTRTTDLTGGNSGGGAGITIALRGAGPAGPTISDVDGDDTVFEGQTSVQINGSGFGATQGTGSVTISPTDNISDGNAVTPTVSAWGDTQITLSAVSFPTGVGEGGTAYVFVTDDSAASNANGHAITRLDITAPLLSSGTATGVTANAATPQVTTNEATGQAWMVLVPSAESTPSAAQIKAGQNAAGGSPVASGTVNPVSATTITFAEVTGLTPSTSYKIAFVQDDDSANESNVTTHTFSTAALPAINTSASFSSGLKLVGSGMLVADESGVRVDVWRNDTGALVLHNQTIATIASGHLSFSHASLPAGVSLHIKAYPTGVLPVAWDQTPA